MTHNSNLDRNTFCLLGLRWPTTAINILTKLQYLGNSFGLPYTKSFYEVLG